MFDRRIDQTTRPALGVGLILTILAGSITWLAATVAAPEAGAAPALPADAQLPACTSVPARPAGTALDDRGRAGVPVPEGPLDQRDHGRQAQAGLGQHAGHRTVSGLAQLVQPPGR